MGPSFAFIIWCIPGKCCKPTRQAILSMNGPWWACLWISSSHSTSVFPLWLLPLSHCFLFSLNVTLPVYKSLSEFVLLISINIQHIPSFMSHITSYCYTRSELYELKTWKSRANWLHYHWRLFWLRYDEILLRLWVPYVWHWLIDVL